MSDVDTQPAPEDPMEGCNRDISHVLEEFMYFASSLPDGSDIVGPHERRVALTNAIFRHYGTTPGDYLTWLQRRLNLPDGGF